ETQQQVLDWRTKHWGAEDPATLTAAMELAYVILLQGKYDESLAHYDEAIAEARRVLGPEDDRLLEAMHNRARVLNKMGRVEEAIKEERDVLAARERLFGKNNTETLGSMGVLAVLEAKQGRFEESKKLVGQTLQYLPPKEWWTRNSMAWFLCTSKYDAVRNGQEALEQAIKACELTDYKAPTCLDTLAAAYAEVGDFASAVRWSERTIELTVDDARREKLTKRL